jgi:membrane fusion protein, copper/silver efflux system
MSRAMKLTPIVVSVVLAACSKGAPANTARAADPVPMTEQSSTSDSSAPQARAVLAAYERVRAQLAADDLKGAQDAARELDAAAKSATSHTHFAAISGAAAKLAASSDIKAARASFGEVSQHVVALSASDKSLAEGHHVFECPMVAGYNKWVQPSKDLQNPYMGKQMLTCGGESSWQ